MFWCWMMMNSGLNVFIGFRMSKFGWWWWHVICHTFRFLAMSDPTKSVEEKLREQLNSLQVQVSASSAQSGRHSIIIIISDNIIIIILDDVLCTVLCFSMLVQPRRANLNGGIAPLRRLNWHSTSFSMEPVSPSKQECRPCRRMKIGSLVNCFKNNNRMSSLYCR